MATKIGRAFGSTCGYGWSCVPSAELTKKVKSADRKFASLRKTMKIDALAFCGSSGAAIAFPLAMRNNVPMIYVRKRGEKSHGSRVECNDEGINTYIIVDDFISTGDTVRHIMGSIKECAKRYSWKAPKCLGILLFDSITHPGERMMNNMMLPIWAPNYL